MDPRTSLLNSLPLRQMWISKSFYTEEDVRLHLTSLVNKHGVELVSKELIVQEEFLYGLIQGWAPIPDHVVEKLGLVRTVVYSPKKEGT